VESGKPSNQNKNVWSQARNKNNGNAYIHTYIEHKIGYTDFHYGGYNHIISSWPDTTKKMVYFISFII
jgi:hypothetical protein